MSKLAELPESLRSQLVNDGGAIADAGKAFNSTDVIEFPKAPFRRLIFAWHRSGRWVVATEHGGRVYSNPVYVFADTTTAQVAFVERRVALQEKVCNVASDLLIAKTAARAE